MPPASLSRTSLSDYKTLDSEWREIFGSGIDLTACMVDILESFNMSAESAADIGLPPDPDPARKPPSPDDTNSTTTTLSADSGLDRHSAWRNSASSSSSNQSALSLVSERDAVDGPVGYHRLSSMSTGSKTHFIMEEITQTEKSYIEDLRQICQGYLQPMRESSLFTSTDVSNVFGNLEDIWDFHQCFFVVLLLPDLCGPGYLANCFIEEQSSFSIYTDYCTNYPTSVNHLSQLMSEFPDWFKAQQVSLGHVLSLGPYLLKPIQRILKYHLLLQKLLDSCDDGEGFDTVEAALDAMKGIAAGINEVQRQKERMVRSEQLRLLLVDLPANLNLSEFGELLLEDTMKTSGAKGERHLFLFDMGLLLAKQREDGTFLFKVYIAHCNLMLSEVIPDSPLQFSIIPFDNPKLLTVLEARNMDQKRAWTTRLKDLMLKHFGVNIPDHVRQLVLQLGQMPAGEVESTTRRFRQIFNSPNAPQYLAKRRTKSPARDYHVKTESRTSREMRRKTAPSIQLDGVQLPTTENSPRSKDRSRSGKPPSKEKKSTSVFHVSDAYIPRMKEDEFLYEETQVNSHRKSEPASFSHCHTSSQTLQENETVHTSPRRHQSQECLTDPTALDPLVNYGTTRSRLTTGLRSALDKAYKQVLRPILKSFNSEENALSSSYPSSSFFSAGFHGAEAIDVDCLDGEPPRDEGCSADIYERDLELLEHLHPDPIGTLEDDSAVCSEGEETTPSSPRLAGNGHPKLRRIYGSAGARLNATPEKMNPSLRRRESNRRRGHNDRTKSAPTTPHFKERGVVGKQPSDLIQERIRTLEERALWRSMTTEELKELEEVRRGMRQTTTKLSETPVTTSEPQLSPATAAERSSWVSLMVKKIESGVQRL